MSNRESFLALTTKKLRATVSHILGFHKIHLRNNSALDVRDNLIFLLDFVLKNGKGEQRTLERERENEQ